MNVASLLIIFIVLVVDNNAMVYGATPAGCRRRVSVTIDVSASVTTDTVNRQGRSVGPLQLKRALRGALQTYLFRDRQSCVAVYTFGTTARRILDFTSVNSAEGRNALLNAIDTLQFETVHPHYYTNWEAGLQAVLDADSRSVYVYLVTDGFPTTRTTGCIAQPCDSDLQMNMDAAKRVSKQLQLEGTNVVAVGIGSDNDISDAALSDLSGPCSPTHGCYKNWNYFHLESYARLEASLGESFAQRLALTDEVTLSSSPLADEKKKESTTTAKQATPAPQSLSSRTEPKEKRVAANRGKVAKLFKASPALPPLPPPPVSLKGWVPRQQPILAPKRLPPPQPLPVASTVAPLPPFPDTLLDAKKKTPEAVPVSLPFVGEKKQQNVALPTTTPSTEVHANSWVNAIIAGCLLGLAVLLVFIAAFCCARRTPLSEYSDYVQQKPSANPNVEASIGIAMTTPPTTIPKLLPTSVIQRR